jgi:hypothetical protein
MTIATRLIPFVYAIDDKALLEITDSLMRIWVDEALVERSAAADTWGAITNGEFTSDIANWTNFSEGTATIAWHSSGALQLTGDGTDSAFAEQEVVVPVGGGLVIGRHSLRVEVFLGPVTLRVGSTSNGEDLLSERTLQTGTYVLSFTPTGNFYVRFGNKSAASKFIDSVSIDAPGVLTIVAPWALADLPNIRYVQSGDVIFVACKGMQQRRIERWGSDSWAIVTYAPDDGPFRIENTSETTLTPSGLTGNVTLTASQSIFRSGHVGSLWRLASEGQRVTETFTGANQFSGEIRVIGVGESRRFAINVSGTWVATVTLQRSINEPGTWEDVTTYTTNQDITYLDELDNQIIYYRLGIKTGQHTSGTADVYMTIATGSITGIARATAFVSSTVLNVEVLEAFGGTDATAIWWEGLWSEYRGWPTAVALHDGRLWWAGKDRFVGSVTDGYSSFDDTLEGDAGPIIRTIGFGPVDSINWLLSLSRLVAGTATRELGCRSSAFDEPLTPTNFTPKQSGSQGSAPVQAVEIDNKGVFLQRGGWRVYEMAYSLEVSDYTLTDLTQICPEFLRPGVVAMAVQRQPDTRIHCVRSDGTVGVLIFDRAENLLCWINVETDGEVEEVAVLPDDEEEDEVYYVVRRTIEGVEYRYLEKWAKETDCRGASKNLQADSFVYAAESASTITGLDHLEGETVVVWAGGLDLGTFVVSGGSVTLPQAYTDRCAGLPYEARFESAKLAYIAPPGKSALGAQKRIHSLGLVLADTHAQGLEFGQDFDNMDPMPLMEEGAAVDQDSVWENYEGRKIPFPGVWTTDARLCLKAAAPRPVTVMAAVIDMDSNQQ